LYANGFALQIGDAADVVTRKQFEASDMHPSQHRHRLAGIDRSNELRGVIRTEIHVATHKRRYTIGVGGKLDVTDIGKAFGAQQPFGCVFRGKADARVLQEANALCLQTAVGRRCRWHAQKATRASKKSAVDEPASGLRWHVTFPPFAHAFSSRL